MSKKKRRRKNNRDKKVFNKNLLIKEEIEARKEIEAKVAEKESLQQEEIVSKDDAKLKLNEKIKDKKVIFSSEIAKGKEIKNNLSLNMRKIYQKILFNLKKWNNIFCTGMTCKTNLKRDIIIMVAVLIAVIFLVKN